MQKGQISFDFILAVIVALIFVGGMLLVNDQIVETQKAAAVRNQERAIAIQLHSIISSSTALSDADYFEVKYKIPKLLVPEEQELQECNIDLDSRTVEYTLQESGETISVEIPEFAAAGAMPGQINCGDVLTITG